MTTTIDTPTRRPWPLLAALSGAHLVIGALLLVANLGTPGLMDDSPFWSVPFIFPFVAGVLLAAAELIRWPVRTVALAWAATWVGIQLLCVAGFGASMIISLISEIVGRGDDDSWLSFAAVSPILIAYTVSAMSVAALVLTAAVWLVRRAR